MTTDPADALADAGCFLAGDPVRNNVILTLLTDRLVSADPGRYWIARDAGGPVGFVFQSPLDFTATVSPMADGVAAACADAVFDAGGTLPGVMGSASSAAAFAGRWTERSACGAMPIMGQRIYEVTEVSRPAGVAGTMRVAGESDRAVLAEWIDEFHVAVGEQRGGAQRTLDRRLPAGHFRVWSDDGRLVSMAAATDGVHGVGRIQSVFTPPEYRGRGYAAACVAALSQQVLDRGDRCILYTDLGNQTSNSVYRRIGYRAVAECTRYRFG